METQTPIEYRSLGRTGMKVSPLCLGCMMFGLRTPEDESLDVIDRALDAGINFLDTANAYGQGQSEQIVGAALKRNGQRDRIILATKVHNPMGREPNMRGSNRRHIIEQCDASLKRLGTDWIDLYQIHRPEPEVPIDETLRALDDLVRSGKVRYIGSSSFAAWQVMESLWVSRELRLNRFVCEQPPYNLLDRRVERELVPMALTYGIGIIPWSPLAGGFLTGKYERGEEPTEGRWAMQGRRGRRDPSRPRRRDPNRPRRSPRKLTDQSYDIAEKVVELAKAKQCTPGQLALAWCMNQPGITSAIIGPRTMDQLVDNLGALAVEVTDEDRAALDEVASPGEAATRYYEAPWGPHLHRW